MKLGHSVSGRLIGLIAVAGLATTMTGVASAGDHAMMGPQAAKASYLQTNLVSNSAHIKANFHDRNLVNPWGLAYIPGNPLWIADSLTGLSTLYKPGGKKVPPAVTIPAPNAGTSHPTGIVANGSIYQFGGNNFIFDTEDGTICAWSASAYNTSTATQMVDNSAKGAVYKGLAMGSNGPDMLIYTTNFAAGTVEAYDSSFNPVTLAAGAFADNQLPAGYAPFGIVNIDNNLYVTYALQDATKRVAVPGPGNGYIDVYATDGTLTKRLIAGGALNAPWGVAMAPANFGPLSNLLLVGNFGDGKINAFDPVTGAAAGQLTKASGKPFVIQGLWALVFGDAQTGSPRTLFFTAGPVDQSAGLFGRIIFGKPKKMMGGGGY